jgi:hypothetical protein
VDVLEFRSTCTCFGEHISQLISIENRADAKNSPEKMITHKMTIDIDMFGALMQNIIMSYLNRTPIVTEYIYRARFLKGTDHVV